MDFRSNITPVDVIKKGTFEELISETFMLVLMVNGIESHGKKLMS